MQDNAVLGGSAPLTINDEMDKKSDWSIDTPLYLSPV